MPTIQRTNSRIYSDLIRGSRLLIIAFPFSVAMVALVMWSDPKASADVIATSAAVPLIVSYLMIRAIMWLASELPELTEEERRRLEEDHKAHAAAIKVEWRRRHDEKQTTAITVTTAGLLAVAFVLGVWCVVAGAFSALIYWCIGLTQAVSMALSIINWTLGIVAATAVLLCLIRLCRASLLKIAKISHDLFDDPFSVFHGRAL